MKEEKLIISEGYRNLSAVLTSPESSITPVVVMCHGYSRDKNGTKYIMLSEKLAEKDMSSLRFDFSGHGDSWGFLEDFTNKLGVDNLDDVVWYLQKRGYKNKQMGISGSSTGAEIAVLYAAKNPEIGALALRAPTYGMETLRTVGCIESPTLVITGEKDTLITSSAARRFFDILNCEKDFKIIQGATHECQEVKHIEELNRLNSEWFERWLK
jgi:alpha/beta superfamily hydrolase